MSQQLLSSWILLLDGQEHKHENQPTDWLLLTLPPADSKRLQLLQGSVQISLQAPSKVCHRGTFDCMLVPCGASALLFLLLLFLSIWKLQLLCDTLLYLITLMFNRISYKILFGLNIFSCILIHLSKTLFIYSFMFQLFYVLMATKSKEADI